jgi:ferredoxin
VVGTARRRVPQLADDEIERRIGDLTVKIDRLICVGFGDCIEESPKAFRFDDEGIAEFTDEAEQEELNTLLEACRSCPVDAIIVLDPDGNQIVP